MFASYRDNAAAPSILEVAQQATAFGTKVTKDDVLAIRHRLGAVAGFSQRLFWLKIITEPSECPVGARSPSMFVHTLANDEHTEDQVSTMFYHIERCLNQPRQWYDVILYGIAYHGRLLGTFIRTSVDEYAYVSQWDFYFRDQISDLMELSRINRKAKEMRGSGENILIDPYYTFSMQINAEYAPPEEICDDKETCDAVDELANLYEALALGECADYVAATALLDIKAANAAYMMRRSTGLPVSVLLQDRTEHEATWKNLRRVYTELIPELKGSRIDEQESYVKL